MLVKINYLSQILDEQVTFHAILPEPRVMKIYESSEPVTEDLPVLYLLHGYRGGPSDWQRKTGVEQFLHESMKHMIIIIPGGYNFFYTNMVHGKRHFDLIADELPRVVQSYFHASQKKEDTYVAGLSMGGYGAMKLALTYPERYGYAASFSGATDIFAMKKMDDIVDPKMLDMRKSMEQENEWIFGPIEARAGSANDTMALLEKVDPAVCPKLYISCGMNDDLYEGNCHFRDKALEKGLDVTYYEQAQTGHEWRFWNTEIEKLIKVWLP